MKVLLIKTSSMGDVVHALPAVTEAQKQIPGLTLDWVVEENFVDIPALHPGVNQVIPVAIRRWRKNLLASRYEIKTFVNRLRSNHYDVVIDSQGLLKSGIVTSLAKGEKAGFSKAVAREALAAMFYDKHFAVARDLHAVIRQKALFAAALGYKASSEISWGLNTTTHPSKQIVLIHATTWASKEWPLNYWLALAKLVADAGYEVLLPAGSAEEITTANSILQFESGQISGRVLAGLKLKELAQIMSTAAGVVSVDTGLGHLAGALDLPSVSLFGSTVPDLTRVASPLNKVLVSDHLPCIPCMKRDCQYPKPIESSKIHPPCFEKTPPEHVWQALQQQIGIKGINPA